MARMAIDRHRRNVSRRRQLERGGGGSNQKGDLAGLYKRLGFGVETRCCADG